MRKAYKYRACVCASVRFQHWLVYGHSLHFTADVPPFHAIFTALVQNRFIIKALHVTHYQHTRSYFVECFIAPAPTFKYFTTIDTTNGISTASSVWLSLHTVNLFRKKTLGKIIYGLFTWHFGIRWMTIDHFFFLVFIVKQNRNEWKTTDTPTIYFIRFKQFSHTNSAANRKIALSPHRHGTNVHEKKSRK